MWIWMHRREPWVVMSKYGMTRMMYYHEIPSTANDGIDKTPFCFHILFAFLFSG